MKKKIIFALIFCVSTVISLIALSACEHKHTYSAEWSSDEAYHWHAATCGHSDEKGAKGEHTYDDGKVTTPATHLQDGVRTYTCTECGYRKSEPIPAGEGDHTFSAEWSSDSVYHWHEATCGHSMTDGRVRHGFDNGKVTTPATHTTDGVKTYTCTECGYKKTEPVPAKADEHTYSTEWSSDATYHWYAATCGHVVTSGKTKHTLDSGTVITPATHTASGVKLCSCTVCGYLTKVTIPANVNDHTFDGGVETTPATHTTSGVKTYTCTGCGFKKTETIPAKVNEHIYSTEWSADVTYHWHAATCGHDLISEKVKHTFDEGTITAPATHTTDGVRTYVCMECGYKKTETIPAKADEHTYSESWTTDETYHWHIATCGHDLISEKVKHTFDDGTITAPATHTTDGVRTYVCMECGYKKTETIPAKVNEHTYSAAWTTDETYHWHAVTCGHELTIEKIKHIFDNGMVTTPATHTTDGVRTYVCMECGYKKTETILAKADEHTYSESWTTDETYHWHIATCGHDLISEKVKHTFDDGTITTPATHTTDGVKTYVCMECGYKKTETILAKADEHTYSELWTTDETYHWHIATCGHDLISEKVKHTFDDGTITAPATHTTDGVKTYACTACGYEKTETIPAKVNEHTYSAAWTTDETYHWHAATCGHELTSQKSRHTFDNGICTVCGCSAQKYGVNLTCNMISAGEVSKKGYYAYTSKVTITSTTYLGYTFVGWYEGKTLVSTQSEYTFVMPDREVTYTAVWSVWKELSAFTFTSTETALTITGLTDKTVTKVVIPDGATTIGASAFQSCSGLTSVTIPNSVTSIGIYAFDNCSGLTSVVIPAGVTSIESCVFQHCSGLTSVNIPDGVTCIGENAFGHCTNLTSVIIPGSVTSIGYAAFQTSGLESVTIKNGLPSIGRAVFAHCTNLTSITIPESVTSIGNGAFQYCYGLTSLTIENGVISIEGAAFYECKGLTSIIIPQSVTNIGYQAFSFCSGLTRIEVAKGNTVYHSENNCLIKTDEKTLIRGCNNSIIPNDGSVTSIANEAFSGCSAMTGLTIPEGVTSIGDAAFYGCSGLTSVIIPDSVTSIGRATFFGCSGLTSVTIGSGMKNIGISAFYTCSKLTDINFNGTKSQWNSISKGSDWDTETGNYTVHCTDGDIKKS